MEFNRVIAVIVVVMAYACLYYWLKTKKILPHHVGFSGPFILIKTEWVGIFDKLARWKRVLIGYASVGVILTILSGIILTVFLVFSAITSLVTPRKPIAIQDMLLIPGLNQYIPSTIAVWIALVLAIIIHEAGHGILSRVENIRVKSTGILTLLIPIGAFVEPDDEDVEKAPLKTKLRIFAAGITNNLVFGVICLVILGLLLGMVVPGDHPFVYGVYAGYPADEAGVLPGTIITAIDDTPIYSMTDINTAFDGKSTGEVISLQWEYKGAVSRYDITLSTIPDGYNGTLLWNTIAGWMGVVFKEPRMLIDLLIHPTSTTGVLSSFATFLTHPLSSLTGMETLNFITTSSPDEKILAAPFPGFWGIVHFLFWNAWINILVGVFNALPIRAFDGGQILRESLRAFCRKHNQSENIAFQITASISMFIVMLLILCIVVPYVI